MGLAEDRGASSKRAALGYERVREWLVGARIEGCAEANAVWTCELRREGRVSRVVWSPRPAPWVPPTAWGVTHVWGLLEQAPRAVVPSSVGVPVPALLPGEF